MAIRYTHPATGEPVQREPWRWVAVFKDGRRLNQFEVSSNGAIFHQIGEVDASNLAELHLEHDRYPSITVAIPDGAKPIHFYRHRTIQELLTGDDGQEHLQREWKIKLWAIGFKHDDHFCLMFADEYGHTTMTDDYSLFMEKALPEGVS